MENWNRLKVERQKLNRYLRNFENLTVASWILQFERFFFLNFFTDYLKKKNCIKTKQKTEKNKKNNFGTQKEITGDKKRCVFWNCFRWRGWRRCDVWRHTFGAAAAPTTPAGWRQPRRWDAAGSWAEIWTSGCPIEDPSASGAGAADEVAAAAAAAAAVAGGGSAADGVRRRFRPIRRSNALRSDSIPTCLLRWFRKNLLSIWPPDGNLNLNSGGWSSQWLNYRNRRLINWSWICSGCWRAVKVSATVVRAVVDVVDVVAAVAAAVWRRGCCAGAEWRCVDGTSAVWSLDLPVWHSCARCKSRKSRFWPPVASSNAKIKSFFVATFIIQTNVIRRKRKPDWLPVMKRWR